MAKSKLLIYSYINIIWKCNETIKYFEELTLHYKYSLKCKNIQKKEEYTRGKQKYALNYNIIKSIIKLSKKHFRTKSTRNLYNS